jgi:osmoprotectant transport system permease protein
MMLIDAWNYILAHPTQFWRALGVHIALSASALLIAAAISIPAGIAVARRASLALAVVNVAIVTHTITAMRGVDADAVDAAIGMGMTRSGLLWRVELPMALPVIFAGLRTAAVQVISGAVLAAFIGGGGLGDFITAGIAMMALPQLLVGAIPVTLLALGTDFLFGALQRRLTSTGLRST